MGCPRRCPCGRSIAFGIPGVGTRTPCEARWDGRGRAHTPRRGAEVIDLNMLPASTRDARNRLGAARDLDRRLTFDRATVGAVVAPVTLKIGSSGTIARSMAPELARPLKTRRLMITVARGRTRCRSQKKRAIGRGVSR